MNQAKSSEPPQPRLIQSVALAAIAFASLGMLGYAILLTSSFIAGTDALTGRILSQAQFPMTIEQWVNLLTKLRLYAAIQIVLHGGLFAGALFIRLGRNFGRLFFSITTILLMIVLVLTPLILPHFDVPAIENDATLALKDVRSQFISGAFVWALLWAALLYFFNSASVKAALGKK